MARFDRLELMALSQSLLVYHLLCCKKYGVVRMHIWKMRGRLVFVSVIRAVSCHTVRLC